MVYVRFSDVWIISCNSGILIIARIKRGNAITTALIPCCRVADRESRPRCFGLSRIDTSTWLIEAGDYLELPEPVTLIEVPENVEFFRE